MYFGSNKYQPRENPWLMGLVGCKRAEHEEQRQGKNVRQLTELTRKISLC